MQSIMAGSDFGELEMIIDTLPRFELESLVPLKTPTPGPRSHTKPSFAAGAPPNLFPPQ